MPENNITLEEAAKLLTDSENLLVLTHEHPDGDTIGCAFALKHALSLDGRRRVEVACCDRVRSTLVFITGTEKLSVPQGFEPDTVCAVDVASSAMLGGMYDRFKNRIKLKIDHHRTSEAYAEYNFVDDKAAACGEIIYKMLAGCGMLNAAACDALYAAVASDTGGFKYGNTTADSLRVAAELIERGADHRRLNHLLFEQRTPGEIAALKLALDGMRRCADGQIAVIGFTNAMKDEYRFDDDDVAPLHSLPREIIGVKLGISVRQTEDDPDLYKVSLRSSGDPDCSAVCAVFGGGGHKGAAGCKIRARSLTEAEEIIIAEAEKAING